MIFKLKVNLIKFLNKLLNLINLNIDLSIKKNQIIKVLNKLKPYDLGYDLIRVGSKNDGGYLIPNILNEVEICFSPGTGNNMQFEKDLINRNIKTFMADGTINEKDIELNNIHFTKKNLASYESEKTITLENWVNNNAKNSTNLLLQMDIESSEYEVVHATSEECLKKFKIIIIEFHYFEKINNHYFYENFNNTINKLLLNFEISHIHANNCQGPYSINGIILPTAIEVTFLRKELCKYKKDINLFPHKLDQKNISNLPDVFLPKEIINN